MSLVKEVADAVDAVAKGIENVRKIVTAVRDGKDYLTVKHPEAKAHVAAMLAEMEKTMTVVARASSVLTSFWFVAGSEKSLERFNSEFQKHKSEAAQLLGNITTLKGSCRQIKEAAEAIEKKALVGRSAFAPIFELFGFQSKKREEELGNLLHDLAEADFDMSGTAAKIAEALSRSLDAVQKALGEQRVMVPANIARAAALLDEHSQAFKPLEEKANEVAEEIRVLVDGLKRNRPAMDVA